jgi:hypothetical protein
VDLLFEPHECEAHALDLFVGQRASFHSPDSLPFEQLSQEFDERKYELRESVLDTVWIYVHPLGQDATKPLNFAAKVLQIGFHCHSVLAKV